jgi:hypothetical protein
MIPDHGGLALHGDGLVTTELLDGLNGARSRDGGDNLTELGIYRRNRTRFGGICAGHSFEIIKWRGVLAEENESDACAGGGKAGAQPHDAEEAVDLNLGLKLESLDLEEVFGGLRLTLRFPLAECGFKGLQLAFFGGVQALVEFLKGCGNGSGQRFE